MNCKACGSDMKLIYETTDIRYTDTPNEEFKILECIDCGLGITTPFPENLDNYYPKEYYDSRLNFLNGNKSSAKKVYDIIERSLAPDPLLPNPGRLLVIGCGPGTKLNKYKKEGWDCIGIEPNQSAVEAGLEMFDLTIYNGTLEQVNSEVEFEPFDAILFDHVFEHIPNPKEVLRISKSLLKKDGRLIIEVPNFGGWGRRLFNQSWGDLDVPRHIYHYTPRSLRELTESIGFSQKKISFDGSPRLPARWLLNHLDNSMFEKFPFEILWIAFLPYGVCSKLLGKSRFRQSFILK
ncbi:class I SAM-dependent methyltransferase [Natranaeroarchaeum sulfidigenes]|uniref:SAM-dependent methyltransferase n=1 Tax=Natranaeroarchaeum sulfidigenes TaxID=2784880 RepID=A0A897MU02_9EURY|nr:class I SAM-dependent methyltransferase [Natranaeroarchaeum sulfidigenes]QSG01705.1 SAM-dependent methyltransferase [Natranaeroarchaeum sulfidigenes]